MESSCFLMGKLLIDGKHQAAKLVYWDKQPIYNHNPLILQDL